MIVAVESVRESTGGSYRSVCRELDLTYSRLMRWRHRQRAGAVLVQKPGPANVEPLDLEALNAQIRQLAHGRERTHGTGALYAQYRDAISRRDLQALVAAVRRELRQEAEALARRVEWLAPGLVWSMDDTDAPPPYAESSLHVLHDLGSRYTLRVLGNEALANGVTVAENLVELFERYAAPLFLKLDNAGNLNHHAVLEKLSDYGVIPLNSPPYYPPYNGAMERKQQELKRQLLNRLGDEPTSLQVLRLTAEVSGYDLNHKRRSSLGDRTACRVLDEARALARSFDRRDRKEVFEEIRNLSVDIVEQLGEHGDVAIETAFRYAAETWMQQNQLIRVTRNGEVLPTFYRFWSH